MSAVEPAWLDRRRIVAIHSTQIREHGGTDGIRDEARLESAIARPRSHALYTDARVPELAAVYALAIARNHPFIDGNKRTAFVALELFLAKNGHSFDASDADAVLTMLAMAAGDITDDAFIEWVRTNSRANSSA
jgi:death on curing protein